MSKCPECNTELLQHNTICQNCGYKLTEESGNEKSKKNIIIISAVVLFIVLIIALCSGGKHTGTYTQYSNRDQYAPISFTFKTGNSGTLSHPSGYSYSFTYEYTNDTHIEIETKAHLSYSGSFSEENGNVYFTLDVWRVKYKKQ